MDVGERSEQRASEIVTTSHNCWLAPYVRSFVASHSPHEHLELQVVVERFEGLGDGASGDAVHHGSLDLEEVAGVEVLADVIDDRRSFLKHRPDVVIDHEVQVALPVPRLLVRHDELSSLASLPLGEHVEARGEENQLGREHGQLALLGFTNLACDSNYVSSFQSFVDGREGILSLRVVGLEVAKRGRVRKETGVWVSLYINVYLGSVYLISYILYLINLVWSLLLVDLAHLITCTLCPSPRKS